MRFRISINILIVIGLLALGLGALVLHRSRSTTPPGAPSSVEKSGAAISPTPSTPAPSVPPEESPSAAIQEANRKTYANQEYDFSFTYPASLGDVVVRSEPGRSDQQRSCRGAGERLHGSFANNSNVDFGFVTSNYRDCTSQPVSLFDVTGLEVRGHTLAIATSGGTDAFELGIEKVLPTASPGVVAYVVTNTVDAGTRGALAAVVKSPIKKIGALVFRTKNLPAADALALLEDIITK